MNQARTRPVVERGKLPGRLNSTCFDRLACAFLIQAIAAILFVLAATAGLQADHNKLLQLEFKRGISRHLACDSEGFCYVLLPTPGVGDGPKITLKWASSPLP